MAATESNMLKLGTKAPGFSLPDADGRQHSLAGGAAATVVMFICNHCPFVKHVRAEFPRLAGDYQARGVAFYAINSNDLDNYPQDGPDAMQREAAELGYTFPYLIDADQSVAQAYQAACTPDFFVFDADLQLAYRGQLDDSRPSNDEPVDGHDLRAALDALLSGQPVSATQTPSIGCNIKWKPGNEPQ